MEQVRISKILSELGLCSRREADEYIKQGLVLLDGNVVNELGTKAYRSQKIELNKKAKIKQSKKLTILLNKPVGYISHLDDDKEFKPASDLINQDNYFSQKHDDRNPQFNKEGLAPAGRLDIDSTGLLILTQDGTIAKKIIGENVVVEKEYLVKIKGHLTSENLDLLNYGLTIDGYKLKPAKVSWQNESQLKFILTEGRNRQIRKMCAKVNLDVITLKRVRIGNVSLGNLPLGQWCFLNNNQSFNF